MSESWDEQLSRVRQMALGGGTWDLSDNDQAALCALLAAFDAQAAALAEARRERIEALEKAAGRERQLSEAWRNLAAAEARAAEAEKALARAREALENIAGGPGDGGCGSRYGPGCDGECQITARATLRAISIGRWATDAKEGTET